jgi:plastocyanin
MKPKALLIPVLVALSFSLVACGDDSSSTDTSATTEPATETSATTPEPSGSAPAPSGEAQRSEKVEIVEYTYGPDPVTVQVGGKVIWLNRDSAPHTATADDGSFDTGTIDQGKLASETFKQAGTYTYFCEIHPTMHGTVEVVEKD